MKTRTIEDAIELAVARHKGQVDKQNVPYILHPLRVMNLAMTLAPFTWRLNVGMAAVMHDVVEDTDTTLDELLGLGYSQTVVDAVDALTHRPGEKYLVSVRRAKANPIALLVKRADIQDNYNRIPTNFKAKWMQKLSMKYSVAFAVLNDDQAWLDANEELVAAVEQF